MSWKQAWRETMGGDVPPHMSPSRPPEPSEIRLADGSPLYHALISPENLVATAADTHDAKKKLEELLAVDPEKVRSCQGKTREQALTILDSIKPGPTRANAKNRPETEPKPSGQGAFEKGGPQVAA